MNRYLLTFTVRPGTESTVAQLLRGYRRPPAGATSSGPPLLRRTSVFMSGQRVVRVVDVAGGIGAVMRHLAGLPQIRDLEEALDPHLTIRRDLRTPEGLRTFLYSALVPAVSGSGAGRRGSDGRPGSGAYLAGGVGAVRCALRYPVRPGGGRQLARLLAGARSTGSPGPVAAALGESATSSVFGREDLVVEIIDSDAPASEVLDRVAKGLSPIALSQLAKSVAGNGHPPAPVDLQTTSSIREFLAGCQMELLTDRRVEVPA